jgi:branched-chain amino acid transport system substrate-binding protein
MFGGEKMKKLFASVLATLFFLMAISIGVSEAGDPIIIGLVAPVTGETALFGEVLNNTIKLLAEQINSAGGLLGGRKLDIRVYDNRDDVVETTNAARKAILNDKVVAFIGTDSSASSIALGDVCTEYKIPMISHVATNSKVTLRDDGTLREWVFRACMADPQQGSILGTYAYEKLGYRNVAIIYNIGSDYSIGMRDAFVKAFTDLGGKISIQESHNNGDVDFRAQISKIKEKRNFDAIFLAEAFYKEIGLIVKQMRDLGVNQPVLNTEGAQVKDILNITGDTLTGSYFIMSYDVFSDKTKIFRQQFIDKWGYDPNANVAADAYLAYDTFQMLKKAIEQSEDASPEKIKNALAKMRDVEGLTCTFSIDAATHFVLREAVIYRWNSDDYVVVEKVIPTHL